ncbi:MAG: DNA polymerase III subunit gamma/tau [Alphaproteobacteria bacterium]
MNNVLSSQKSYKVLARKYRPASFQNLIGQESLVTTLSNAIKLNRFPHALLLTGIRGIGKTTTARIVAKTINCTNINFVNDIVEACGTCDNCKANLNERHPDIIEMDAASKTGVGDIREIIENANYLPLIGKYKIYIIDEIHMLSSNAFNALLKTLEEPPAHVIFIFATTEVRKLPLTILSRCQKFDLKRLDSKTLYDHLKDITNLEKIEIEDKALKLIVSNAEGSVRDSLSLLDQAISLSANQENFTVTKAIVTNMLGGSETSKKYDLLTHIFQGDIVTSISLFQEIYYSGYDPVLIFEEMLELIHLVTKFKLIPSENNFLEADIDFISNSANNLHIPALTSLWQMLLKGIQEVKEASNKLSASEMILIRICYAANLPSPIDLINDLKKDNNSLIPEAREVSPKSKETESNKPPIEGPPVNASIKSFQDLVNLCYSKQELILFHYLVEEVHLINFEPGKIEFKPTEHAPKDLALKIAKFIFEQTNEKWSVTTTSTTSGDLTIRQAEMEVKNQEKLESAKNPIVKTVLDNFNGASIVNVRDKTIQ